MKHKTNKPTKKVMMGGIGGAGVAPLLIWGLGMAGIAFPPAAAAAAAGLLGMFIAWLVEDS